MLEKLLKYLAWMSTLTGIDASNKGGKRFLNQGPAASPFAVCVCMCVHAARLGATQCCGGSNPSWRQWRDKRKHKSKISIHFLLPWKECHLI